MPKPPKIAVGEHESARLRRAIARVLPPILQKLYELAIQGDVQAAKLLLDRALPPLAPVRDAVLLEGDDPKAWREDLVRKVTSGEMAPREALLVLDLLDRLPRKEGDKAKAGLNQQTLQHIQEALYGKTS
jgi:hypothetical protein